MPKRKPPSTEVRLTKVENQLRALRGQLAELGASRNQIDALADDVAQLETAIRRRGATPNPDRRRELDPQTRQTRVRNAAIARASKPVGHGQGKVLTKATKKRLQAEAERIDEDE